MEYEIKAHIFVKSSLIKKGVVGRQIFFQLLYEKEDNLLARYAIEGAEFLRKYLAAKFWKIAPPWVQGEGAHLQKRYTLTGSTTVSD